MIVVDASVVVAYLCGEADAEEQAAVTSGARAPALIDVEVTQTLRGLVRGGKIDISFAEAARVDLMDLGLTRYPDVSLLARAWGLRDVCSTYDALYLALAEALDAALYTRDARLQRGATAAAGVTCTLCVTGG